ncbi:IS256 family transposase [Streptomyces sp. 5-6(2022)]|uniref:IS256 family transposase n=1 Tax=Streptomyces sp. 5-6(2022) TaxID=2936510 RepID=UPI0023B8B9C6|nr:IS256 family transposase [Streptomyces sp. 5-6(2022)]
MIYCGIDWAEKTHDVALVDDTGRLLAKRHITDDAPGYKVLLELLADHGDSEESPIPVAIETSRGLLVAVLRTGKRQVFAINPLAAARYRDRHSVSRLTQQWQADHTAFMDRDLAEVDYVYVWADGIHLNVHLEEAKACVLVLIGVHADGSKELVALKDGYRESDESWADLMRDCARRGMRPPILAVGDGALGFWKALAEVFPATREQKCWVHKTANVLDSMPKSAQLGAKKAIQDIYHAEDHGHAEAAVKTFAKLYGAKFPKAVKKITDDHEQLLAFFDFPAEHWIHLRTTNPIESTFATVRLRAKVTRGAGSRTAALAMLFKLVESAQQRWRAVNAPHLVALVRAGARFERGHLIERPQERAA